jgi:hypothetical protein
VPRLEIDCECVAETLVHECDLLVVGRDVGALTEVGDEFDIRREMIQRTARFPLGDSQAAKSD